MKSSLEVQQQMSVLSSHVQENLSGMHVVKAYSQEDFQTQQFIGLNKDYEVKSMEMAKMRGIVNPMMQGINGLTVLIVIWYGGVRVLRGDLLVADIVAFIAYLNVLAWPTAAFGWMLSLVERGRAAMRRLEEILETEPAIASQAAAAPVHGLKQGIEFRNVSFAYERPKKRPRGPRRHRFQTRRSASRWDWSAASVRARAPSRNWCRGCSMLQQRRDSHGRAAIFASCRCSELRRHDRLCAAGPVFVFDLAAGAISPSAAMNTAKRSSIAPSRSPSSTATWKSFPRVWKPWWASAA